MKKVISLLMSFVMLFSVISSVNLSAYAEESATSGKCGDNVYWSYDEGSKTLTISGTGAMYDYSYNNPPWSYRYRENILIVKIETDVTTISDCAFGSCKNLTSVTIPDSVTTIGGSAFSYCSNLKSVTIPDSVTTIGEGAFYFSSLTSVTIGNSVTTIRMKAFSECSSLTSVTIGNSVTTIGKSAFSYCDSLANIEVASGNLNYLSENGALFDKNKSILIQYPAGNQRTEYAIPNSVTTIGEYAFSECRSLKSVTIPDSVTTIGGSAFTCCSELTSVTIPNSVTTIGERAFDFCFELTSVTIPDSVTTIGDCPFSACRSLTNIYVDSGNSNYSSENGVLFNKNKSILIQYPTGNQRIEYAIPNSVTTIGEYAFSECRSLTSVTIGNSVRTIDKCAFYICSSLTSVTIPNSVTTIWMNAFSECGSLTSVTIGNGVTTIGYQAFEYCSNLKDVYYSGSEEQWKKISIGSSNDELLNATIHYNSSLPSQPEIPDKPDSTKLKPQSFKVVNKPYEGKYGFYYTDDYFKKPATKYNQSLATMSLCLALSTYQNEEKEIYFENVKNVFDKCGFVVDGSDSTFHQENYLIKTGTDTIACSFANKKIGDSTLVAVAVRSGGYGAEWASNLTLGSKGDHFGFDDASSKVYKYLADYVNSRNITGKVKFWVTGFSRGGATANLLAAKLDNTIDSHPKITYSKEDVYAYTFATPAGAVKSNNPHSKKYNNIFNIINFHDLVPLVAPSQFGWSFDRYGITKVLPFSESTSVSAIYEPKMIKYLKGMGYEYKVNNFKSYINFGNEPVVQKNNFDTLGVFNRKFIKSVANQIGGRPAYVLSYQNELRSFVSKNALGIANGVLNEVERSSLIKLLLGESILHPHLTATALKNFDLLTVVHSEDANYLAWMMCMDKNYDPSNHEYFTNGDYRVVKVNCPVDVNVYDESNNLVASIINDVPQQIDGSTIISSIDENEQKVVYLPVDGEYRVEVKARENCQTTYSVNEYTGFSSDLSKVVAYQDVDMKKNETLVSNVDSYTNEEISDEEGTTNGSSVDYNLELNNKELAPEVNATGEEIKNVTYTVNVSYDENQGTASAGGEFTAGDFCLLTATAKEGFAFDGWYIDGKKVSSDASYRFAVKSNVNVEAKFKSVETGGGSTDPTPTPGGGGGGGAIPAPIPDETDKKDDNKKPETKPNQSQNTSTSATQKLRVKKLVSKRKALVVYWNKIANVSGYQIQVATDKKFKKNKKTVTVAKQNASKKTVKKLKAKKKYFVRVRAYKIVDGKKSYGKWSKIKSVKTK
ncbi:leucine-rich repeat protein [Eubacterium sp.]|uniref:leucine-rich repeat protein n=1 Tax=Eubacterium sp. TaxID=142586 RepID=UPI0025C15D32|nr:leucine-rich repeat protein [Eubacterium sp.]